MPGSPGLRMAVAQPFPDTPGLGPHPAWLEPGRTTHTFHLPYSGSRGNSLGQLAYGYRHPFNKNLIHLSIPRVSKVKCINENTNSKQKVVINVQRTCAASLIMLPGNRGRDGRAPPGALQLLSKAEVLARGKGEPHKQCSPP